MKKFIFYFLYQSSFIYFKGFFTHCSRPGTFLKTWRKWGSRRSGLYNKVLDGNFDEGEFRAMLKRGTMETLLNSKQELAGKFKISEKEKPPTRFRNSVKNSEHEGAGPEGLFYCLLGFAL